MTRSTRLIPTQLLAGHLAQAQARHLVNTFSANTRAKGRLLAQAKAQAKAERAKLLRRARYALATAERQQAKAIAKAQTRAAAKRASWTPAKIARDDARQTREALQAAQVQIEREVVARARRHYERTAGPVSSPDDDGAPYVTHTNRGQPIARPTP